MSFSLENFQTFLLWIFEEKRPAKSGEPYPLSAPPYRPTKA